MKQDAWTDALTQRPDGLLVALEVVPGAATSAFPSGYNPWRRRLQARVTSPPIEGRANDELRRLLAVRLHVPLADVELVEGATSRQKRFFARGATMATAVAALQEALDAR